MFSRKSADFPDRAGLCCYWEKQSVSIPVLSARPDWPPSAPPLLLFALHLRRTDNTERHAGDVTLWQGRCGAVRSSACLWRDWLSKRWGGVAKTQPNPFFVVLFVFVCSVFTLWRNWKYCTQLYIFSSTYLSWHCCNSNGKTRSLTLLTSVIKQHIKQPFLLSNFTA